jgi:hypothetical protein
MYSLDELMLMTKQVTTKARLLPNIYKLSTECNELNGDVAEVGVYQGGSAKFIAKCHTNKTVHLFDTFTGMPEIDKDVDAVIYDGAFADTSYEAVSRYLAECPNVRIYKGYFPDTGEPVANKKFCFVHIDVDLYSSTTECLAFFWSRLVEGGIVILDDYSAVVGATKAVNDFFEPLGIKPAIIMKKEGT